MEPGQALLILNEETESSEGGTRAHADPANICVTAGSLVNARFARNLEHSAQQMLLSFPRGSCLPQCRGRAVPCGLASPCFDVCLFGCDKGHHVFIISDSAVIYVIPKCLLDTHWRVTQNVTLNPSPPSPGLSPPAFGPCHRPPQGSP